MEVKTKGKLVSIVINGEFIKICEVTKQGKNITVHKAVTIPTPEGCYKDGVISDIPTIAKAMRLVMDEHRFSSNNVAFSISSTRLATKEVLIPNVKENKIEKLVSANATEYFPVNMDEYIIQHTVLDHVEDQGQPKIKILVAAVPTDVVESYYDLARVLGLKVSFVDYAGNSTYQLMNTQIGEEVSLVIQVENDTTVVNIYANNVLQLQRIVPYGKSLLVNAVMEQYHVDYEGAVAKLQNETLLHSRFDGDEASESLRYLVGNINRIIDYFVSRNHTSIQKSYLIGHCTTIRGFTTLISNEMNMPVAKIDTLKGVTADRRTYVDESSITSYVTNIGAIVKPVNFIPKKMLDQVTRKDNTKTLIVILIAAVAASAVLIAIPLVKFVALQANIASLNKSIESMKGIEEIVDDYYQAKDKFDDANAFATMTKNYDDNLGSFVGYLEKNMPSDIVVTSMNVTSGSVSISGTADSKSSVAAFIQLLEKSPYIVNVDVPNISENKDNTGSVELTFSISCVFVGDVSK